MCPWPFCLILILDEQILICHQLSDEVQYIPLFHNVAIYFILNDIIRSQQSCVWLRTQGATQFYQDHHCFHTILGFHLLLTAVKALKGSTMVPCCVFPQSCRFCKQLPNLFFQSLWWWLMWQQCIFDACFFLQCICLSKNFIHVFWGCGILTEEMFEGENNQ